MTQKSQHLDATQDNDTSDSRNVVGSTNTGTSIQLSSSHLNVDSASDNDTSERPVREKLKKTSLASLPRDNFMSPRAHTEPERDDSMLTHHAEEESVPTERSCGVFPGPRGRPLRKRSFDDIEPAESDTFEVSGDVISNTGGHARKRSRDVRVGAGFDGENRKRGAPERPVQEVDEQNLSDNEMADLEDNRSPESGAISPIQCAVDEDMTDSALLPRKKRSRDQFDTDTDREQKIPATEEAKAQRRSEESERNAVEKGLDNEDSATERGDQVDQEVYDKHVKHDEDPENSNADKDDPAWAGIVSPKDNDNNTPSKQKLGRSFGNSSTISPFASLASQKTSKSPTSSSKPVKDETSHTSNTAFAASGFAALSSTTSPFGALDSFTKANISSPFSSLIPRAKSTDPETGESSRVGISQVPNGGLSAPSTTLSFGMAGLSAFGSAGVSPPTQFGTFGSGFGSAFGTGPRLNSFAAPKGDAVLGSGSGTISSFGQPDKDDDDDSRSDSEDEALSDTTRDQEGAEANDKSHHQGIDTGEDDEETIFSSPRVNLYAWDGKTWKERGGGIFKLNVPKPNPDDAQSKPRTARFIMRAHQTYRVLLNTPIFKQLKIGDKDGNAPRGRLIAFAGIEDGKPIPYQIKLNDKNESKILHGDVKKLQETL